MDQKAKKNFLTVIVFIVIAGMVFSYIPLFMTPNYIPEENISNVDANTPPVVVPKEDPTPVTTSSNNTTGFSGLEEENESFDNLNDLLK